MNLVMDWIFCSRRIAKSNWRDGAQGITYVDLCDPPYRRDFTDFDHIMMLKNGKIHASGKRQQILTKNVICFYGKPVFP